MLLSSYISKHSQTYPPSGITAWEYGNETDLHISGRQVPIPGTGEGGHSPVEAATVVVGVGDCGVDEESSIVFGLNLKLKYS